MEQPRDTERGQSKVRRLGVRNDLGRLLEVELSQGVPDTGLPQPLEFSESQECLCYANRKILGDSLDSFRIAIGSPERPSI